MTTRRRPHPLSALVVVALLAAACGRAGAESAPGVDLPDAAPVSTEAPPTTRAAGTTSSTSSTSSTTTSTTTLPATSTTSLPATSTTTDAPTTTTSAPAPEPDAPTTTTGAPAPSLGSLPNPWMTETNAAFDRLAAGNAAASVSVVRDGALVVSRASGSTIAGDPATPDSPMVVASVSKIVTAVAVARLAADGVVDPAGPVPWADLGVPAAPGWADVTVRELLDHTSGMAVARTSWFQQPGDCRAHLPSVLGAGPDAARGRWRYSNGNYCALGLLVEQRTGMPLDAAVQQLVFDPIGADGVRLSTGGHQPGDVRYRLDLARLSRLGGAGTFLVSTDDLALMADGLTAGDLALLTWPGVFTDQYGWGHTGTVDGAKSCLWVVEGGRTAVAATIAGDSVGTGGAVCDLVVPAVVADLHLPTSGRPDRTPPP